MLIINDLPEVQEPMSEPELVATKDDLLNLYAKLRHAQAVMPAEFLKSSVLELGQLSAALRFHYHVCDTELLYAIEVRS
jgi:hypothetical protein